MTSVLNYNPSQNTNKLSLQLSYKIELFATVFECMQQLVIATKSSILDVGSNQDALLITIFGKVIIHLVRATFILFHLLAISGSSCLYGNSKVKYYWRI